jgi:hypothetical protein
MRSRLVFALAILASAAIASYGQIMAETAQAHLCFPQFADGGPVSGQWQTTFTFVNSYNKAVSVTLYLVGNDGQPFTMDFGGGAGSQFSFSVPAMGTTILQSRVASSTITTGWAEAYSTVPIQGVVSYRFLQNGIPSSEISVASTLPTMAYISAANAYLGIALVNTSSTATTSLQITAHANDGSSASATVALPPRTHRAFILSQVITTLNSNFVGTIDIGGLSAPYPEFLAWTLKNDGRNVYSSLPSGAVALPVSQSERIWRVYTKVFDAARRYIPSPDTVQLYISNDVVVNAFGNSNGIQINLALAELIADSDSELAAVIGHELGHVYQRRTGKYDYNTDPEWDADMWGLLLAMLAGYDPYGAPGALGKIYMATGNVGGLVLQFYEDYLSSDMHKSLGSRLDAIYTTISQVCSSTDAATACSNYRQVFHPHMPGGLF